MKVLIMAAGVGSRISRYLTNQPKCCVEVNGQPLIRSTFELFKRKGITDIAMVTGYQEKYVHQAVEGFSYTRYFNPFYRVTNSISSVWFARDFVYGDDLIIMNGDVFMEGSVLDLLLNDQRSPVLLADSSRILDADYRFYWEESKLIGYGKSLKNEETTGEYVGLAKLRQEHLATFRQGIVDAISAEDYGIWWEDVIYRTVDKGEEVFVNDVKGHFWAEVDYIEDYQRIQKFTRENTCE